MICLVWDFIVRDPLDMNYILLSNDVGRSMCPWEEALVGALAQYTALWGDMQRIYVCYMCHVMTIYGLIVSPSNSKYAPTLWLCMVVSCRIHTTMGVLDHARSIGDGPKTCRVQQHS